MRGVMAFQRRLPWRHDAELARAGSLRSSGGYPGGMLSLLVQGSSKLV
jgi:hypothetical protein